MFKHSLFGLFWRQNPKKDPFYSHVGDYEIYEWENHEGSLRKVVQVQTKFSNRQTFQPFRFRKSKSDFFKNVSGVTDFFKYVFSIIVLQSVLPSSLERGHLMSPESFI